MTITYKDAEGIAGMRVAGRLAAEVLDYLTPFIKPGVTTNEIDKLAHDYITQVQGAIPAPLNYAPAAATTPTPNPSAPRSTTRSATAFPTTSRSKKATSSTSTSPSSRTAGTATPAACSWWATSRSPPSACAHMTYEAMWHGIMQGQAGRASGRHWPRHPDICRRPGLQRGARVLWPRHRARLS